MNQGNKNIEIEPLQSYPLEEIDLFELAVGLWAKKWTIVTIALAALLAGVVYILITPSIYMAEAQVRPPSLSDLVQINETLSLEGARIAAPYSPEGGQKSLVISPQSAFQKAMLELKSPSVKHLVLKKVPVGTDEEHPEGKDYSIDIRLPKRAKNGSLQTSDSVTVTVSYNNPEIARDLLNEHIKQANSTAVNTLVGELKGSLKARITHMEALILQAISMEERANLDAITRLTEADELARLELGDKITALKKKTLQLRLDKISVLEEAYSIAKSLKIDEPISLTQLNQGSMAFNASFSNRNNPYYLRGTRMLSAEITALKNRKSDDFTIPEIRQLEEQLTLLDTNRKIQLLQARKDNSAFLSNIGTLRVRLDGLKAQAAEDYSAVRVLRLVQPAVTPVSPISPRKKLILVLCLFAGGFLGMLVALIRVALASRRE